MRETVLESMVIAGKVLRELWRGRRSLVFWGVFPVLMLLLFGLIYAGNGRTGPAFDRVAPGILIGAALFFSCLGGPITVIVGERERGTLRRLLLTPISPSGYPAGVAVAFAVVGAGQAVLVYGLALFFGGRFHGSFWLGLLVVLLSVTAYVSMGFAFGARFARRTEDVNGPVAAFGVPLLVLGGTFFDPAMLPGWLRQAAWLDPIFHMNEALRAVSALGSGPLEIWPHLVVLGLCSMAGVVVARGSFRSLLARERGGA